MKYLKLEEQGIKTSSKRQNLLPWWSSILTRGVSNGKELQHQVPHSSPACVITCIVRVKSEFEKADCLRAAAQSEEELQHSLSGHQR